MLPQAKVDKARKVVNNVMAAFVLCVDGVFVHHPHIVFDKPGLFLRDKVHLSPKGNGIFFGDIAQTLKNHVVFKTYNKCS